MTDDSLQRGQQCGWVKVSPFGIKYSVFTAMDDDMARKEGYMRVFDINSYSNNSSNSIDIGDQYINELNSDGNPTGYIWFPFRKLENECRQDASNSTLIQAADAIANLRTALLSQIEITNTERRNAEACAKRLAALSAQTEARLTKPARIGATTFNAGVLERLVIDRAQREYEWHINPPFKITHYDELGRLLNPQPKDNGFSEMHGTASSMCSLTKHPKDAE